MLDATVAWSADPSPNVTSYNVVWSVDGTALPAISVPRTAAQDSAGYTLDFVTSEPGQTVVGGEVIGATVQSVDATDSIVSPVIPSVPPTVTEPVAPLTGPTNVVLALA